MIFSPHDRERGDAATISVETRTDRDALFVVVGVVWDESFRGIVHDEDARLLCTHDPTSLYIRISSSHTHSHSHSSFTFPSFAARR